MTLFVQVFCILVILMASEYTHLRRVGWECRTTFKLYSLCACVANKIMIFSGDKITVFRKEEDLLPLPDHLFFL